MSFRSVVPPPRAFSDLLDRTLVRLTEAERRAAWPSRTRTAVLESMDPLPSPELMNTPGYPTYTTPTVSLGLDPGRWIVMFRAALSIAASDGGEVAMISTATYDGGTTTNLSRGGGATVAVGRGNSYTLSNAIEIKAKSGISLSLPVYWGYEPLVDPVPYVYITFTNASIVAFPG